MQEFQHRLADNILALHNNLTTKAYVHSSYHAFTISDPKPRSIHKASVRDRLLHHALYRTLYPFFDRTWIADSYSCRQGKGVHKANNRFRAFAYRVSHNHTRTARVLKCDVRKFFASIDQEILMGIVARYIPDTDILWLIGQVVGSFNSTPGKGLPLGNLTSQLFANVYLNELDQFVKRDLKATYYIRYADDFVVFSRDKKWLTSLVPCIAAFLHEKLCLSLHPDKVSLRTVASGVDFLGWVHFVDHRVLRTATRKRMFRRLEATDGKEGTIHSYLGLLQHGNTKKLQGEVQRRSI